MRNNFIDCGKLCRYTGRWNATSCRDMPILRGIGNILLAPANYYIKGTTSCYSNVTGILFISMRDGWWKYPTSFEYSSTAGMLWTFEMHQISSNLLKIFFKDTNFLGGQDHELESTHNITKLHAHYRPHTIRHVATKLSINCKLNYKLFTNFNQNL